MSMSGVSSTGFFFLKDVLSPLLSKQEVTRAKVVGRVPLTQNGWILWCTPAKRLQTRHPIEGDRCDAESQMSLPF